MKCKYCKTKISFGDVIFRFCKCISCQAEMEDRKTQRRREDSRRYWEKQK